MIETIWFYIAIICIPLVLGFVMYYYTLVSKPFPGFRAWMFSNFSYTVSFMFIATHGILPDFFPLILGNIFVLASPVLVYVGFKQFKDEPVPWRSIAVLFFFYTLFQFYFVYVYPDLHIRIIVISTIQAIIFGTLSIWLYRSTKHPFRSLTRVSGIIFVLLTFTLLTRVIYTIVGMRGESIVTDQVTVLLLYVGMLLNIAWTFSGILLNNFRYDQMLQAANTELSVANVNVVKQLNQLSILNEMSSMIAQLDEADQIITATLEYIVTRLKLGPVVLFAVHNSDHIQITHKGPTPVNEAHFHHNIQKNRAMIQNALKMRESLPILISNSPVALVLPVKMNEGGLDYGVYIQVPESAWPDSNTQQTLKTMISQTEVTLQNVRYSQTIQVQLRLLTTLQSASQIILSNNELKEVFLQVLHQLKATFGYPYLLILSYDQSHLLLQARIGYDDQDTSFDKPTSQGVLSRCIVTKEKQFVPNVNLDPDYVRVYPDICSEICVPILLEDRLAGVLVVESTEERPLTERDLTMLSVLANPIGIAIENARLHADVKALAMTDIVTGMYNRRSFNSLLAEEIKRSARYNETFALLILDVDDFKKINDTYGHPVGDAALRWMGDLFRQELRETDVAARYGGDEFAVILSKIDKAGALQMVERLRKAASIKSDQMGILGLRITFSLGIALFPEHGKTYEQILFQADNAELQAKKQGKDQVCMAGEAS